MYDIFDKQKYPAILLFVGIILILIGFFDIKDISKFHISERSVPNYTIVIFGGLLSVVSIVIYLFEEFTLGWFRNGRKIIKTEKGFRTLTSNSEVNILFGKLEDISDEFDESMVVLPANEFFDDECINDKKSALGAYINYKFTNQSEQIKNLIIKELKAIDSSLVEKEEGIKKHSYGVGTGILLKEALNSKQPILFIAVTTKRAGQGLRSEMSYIFQAVKKIQSIAADNRIDSIFIPIMGSGHGGLKKEVALFGLLLAIFETLTKPYSHHIKKFNVVVYQSDNNEKPMISKSVAKRLLKISSGMFS